MAVAIREATADDWPSLWHIIEPIVRAGETYAVATDMSEEEARGWWVLTDGVRTTVAELDGEIAGTANGYANRQGNGAHVASGSFMVSGDHSGEGVGRALAQDFIAWAREAGFRSIQFNAVVETNRAAIALWESLGFETVGTVPRAFDHPGEGLVALQVMYLEL